MDQFDIVKRIGSGSFGVALLVKKKNEGPSSSQYVIKQINLTGMSAKEIKEAEHEVSVLQTLSGGNSFIIGYHEAFTETKKLHIVLDYADGGDLSDYIAKTKRNKNIISEKLVLKWFIQLCSALKYIHGRKILHRDLKTQNIFLASIPNEKHYSIKLGDFGIAKVLQSTSECANTIIGTPYYLSPELCEDRPYNEKSDVWALGCVLYEMCTLNHAFDGKSMCALVLKILKGKYPPIKIGGARGYSKGCAVLIENMLQYDADKRPSVHRMLESKFLQSYIHQYEKKERINVHTCIRTASDRNMNGMRTRERQLQKESREKAIKALSPNIHKIRKHQRQLSFEFEQNRKARRGRIDNRNQGWISNNNNNNIRRGSAQNNAASNNPYYDGAKIVNHRLGYGQNNRRRRNVGQRRQEHGQHASTKARNDLIEYERSRQARALASKIRANHKKPINSHQSQRQNRLETESIIARQVYENEMRLKDEKKKLKSQYKSKRKTSQEMAKLHEKQLKHQIKNVKPKINIKELREKARLSREEGNEDDNWKFDGCVVPLNYKNLTPRNEEEFVSEFHERHDDANIPVNNNNNNHNEDEEEEDGSLEQSIRLKLDDEFYRNVMNSREENGEENEMETTFLRSSTNGGMPWEDNTSLTHFGDDERYLSDLAEAHDFTLTMQQSDEFSKKLKVCDDIEALKVSTAEEENDSSISDVDSFAAEEVSSLFSSGEFSDLKSPSPREKRRYKSSKVEKLRVECENKLGDTLFIKAYRFIAKSMETFGMDDDFKMEEDFYILVSNTDLDEDEKSVMLAKIQLLLLLEEKLNEQINHQSTNLVEKGSRRQTYNNMAKKKTENNNNRAGGVVTYTLNL